MANYHEEADAVTGEILTDKHDPTRGPQPQQQMTNYAPGGGVIPPPAHTAGAFVDMLEDGQLSVDLQNQLKELAEQIRIVSNMTGGKARGTATLKLTVEADGDGSLKVQGDIKIKTPEMPRRRSIMWQDDSGAFTRFPPNQTQMFGTAPIRRVG